MLVLRLLVMVLTIICLMDGHAEVSSSTTGIRDRRESPAVKTNDSEVDVLDRKKKKKPKPSKKKKPKPGKKKPKPNKAKPKPTKPVTTTTTMSTSTLKTTTILTTPTITTTATTTTTTVSPTTTETTVKTTTSTASATTTLSTTTSATTSATTTTVATSSTASTATTTIPTTATTSSLPTTAATTADSGAGGECKATNGKPCIFPFKDGNEEYNECKNEGGKYFWCATSVYDSGKYKHWSYCPEDRSCPLEGDGECRATNNKPCVFPFKDGVKEYNECADHGGQYFWCATGTNSAGKYTAWSKCPNDGSCPLPQKGTTPVLTSTATTAVTTPPTNGTSAAATAIANVENTLNEINDTLQNLETAGFSEDEKQLLETMNELSDYLETNSLTRSWNYDPVKINSWTQQLSTTTANIKVSKEVNPGFLSAYQTTENKCSKATQKAKLSQVNAGPGRMFQLDTISEILGIITNAPSSSVCCAECKALAADSELFEHSSHQKQCDCYKTTSGVPPQTMASTNLDCGVCTDEDKKLILVCPDGYSEKSNAPSFYLLKDWTYNKDAEDVYVSANICATECKQNTKCDAVVSTVCKGCRLLTKQDSAHTPHEKVNHYCLYEPAYNVQSNGGANTMFPELMGIYKLSEETQNSYPVYKQLEGSGAAYVEPKGNWAIVEDKYVSMGSAHLYSTKRPILETPPTDQWYYDDGKAWTKDATLTMSLVDSGPSGKMFGIHTGNLEAEENNRGPNFSLRATGDTFCSHPNFSPAHGKLAEIRTDPHHSPEEESDCAQKCIDVDRCACKGYIYLETGENCDGKTVYLCTLLKEIPRFGGGKVPDNPFPYCKKAQTGGQPGGQPGGQSGGQPGGQSGGQPGGQQGACVSGSGAAVPPQGKQYRCYSFHLNGLPWSHRYMWHEEFHIPIYSVARLDDIDVRNNIQRGQFVSDDAFLNGGKIAKRSYNPCGGQFPVINNNEVPHKEFDNIKGMNHGHLLAAQFFLNFFPGDVNNRNLAQAFMSNIFPQNFQCNVNGGKWSKYELEFMRKAADSCLQDNWLNENYFNGRAPDQTFQNLQGVKKNRVFYIAHALVPDKDKKTKDSLKIQKVNYIYNNYCCVNEKDNKQVILGWQSAYFNNPYQSEGECDQNGWADDAIRNFGNDMKNSGWLINIDNNPNQIHPFKGQNVEPLRCITGFRTEFDNFFPTSFP